MDPYNIDLNLLRHNWKRLKLRELWQDAVYSNRKRSTFWSDSSKVRCIHGLAALNTFGKVSRDDGTEALKKLEELIQYTQAGKIAELSCIGFYMTKDPSSERRLSFGEISIEFTEREVVWASANDCSSQCLSSASPYLESLEEYFQIQKELELEANVPMTQRVFGASLLKFPQPSSLMKILLSEKDIRQFECAREVIVRNYTLSPETVIINIPAYEYTREKEQRNALVQKIQTIARRYFNGKEFLIEFWDRGR